MMLMGLRQPGLMLSGVSSASVVIGAGTAMLGLVVVDAGVLYGSAVTEDGKLTTTRVADL